MTTRVLQVDQFWVKPEDFTFQKIQECLADPETYIPPGSRIEISAPLPEGSLTGAGDDVSGMQHVQLTFCVLDCGDSE